MTAGRALIALGVAVVCIGLLVEFAPALRLGRLPGDLRFGSGNVRVFVPLGTSIVLSVVLSLIVALLRRR